jgi:hypothetical protein
MNQADIEDYKKIGVDVLRIYKQKNRWFFKKDGVAYDMAPAEIVDFMLSPLIIGANRLIEAGFKAKGMKESSDFYLLFSGIYFPNADVKLKYSEPKFNGWIYDIEGLNIHVDKTVTSVWVCPYLGAHYSELPRTLYLRIEEDSDAS